MIRFVLLFLAGCGLADAEHASEQANVPDASAVRVEVAALAPTDATLTLSLPGEVRGAKDVSLAAALGGYVESVDVSAGDRVSKGKVLARVDASIYAAQRDQALAQRDQAASELRRLERLGDMANGSQVRAASTQLKVAEANLSQARARLRRALITAPFSGTVATVDIDRGEVAGPGAPVIRLVDLDAVEISLSVSDRDVVALRPETPVAVNVASQPAVHQGIIDRIAPAADLRTRAFEVVVRVDNPDQQLLPGMIARVTLAQAVTEGALVIPQDWLVTRLADRGVFVVEDGVAAWRPIELGAIVRDQIVVTQGLSEGDRVIMNGHRDLVAGDALLVAREGICCSQGRAVFR